MPMPIASYAGRAPFQDFVGDDFSRVVGPVNAIFGAYLIALTVLAAAAWGMGMGGVASMLAFGMFLAVNVAFSQAARERGNHARIEIARVAAGALLAPAAYLLAGDPFMRWWPGFLIMCLGGTIFVSLHSTSRRPGRLLAAYYVVLLAGAEFLAPPPHDWYMLAINAGAVAMVAMVFAELVALLGRTLTAERERRVELAERTMSLERALAEQQRFAAIIEATSDYVGIADLSGRSVYVNRAGRRMVGLPDTQTKQGNYVADCYPPHEAGKVREMVETALRGSVWAGEIELRHADGHLIPVSEVTFLLPDTNGRPEYLATIIRDISAHKRSQAELAAAKEAAEGALARQRRLTDILEATSDFVGIADRSGRVLYINTAGKRMIGLPALADERALDFSHIFTPEAITAIFERGVPSSLRDGAWHEEIGLLHRDGGTIATSFVGLVHKSADGSPELLSCIARDITGRKREEAELKQAKEAAEAANRAKSAFLATMSHEIRTPMNAVIGMTSLLLETPLSPRQRDFVETVRASGDALLTIINDILDFSKIEADKLELVHKPLVLRESIETVLDLLAPRAAEKGLEVAYFMEPDVPGAIVGDVTRLRQILLNLIGNAVKFTDDGEVVLTVSSRPLGVLAPGATPCHELTFSVRDTGPGIPAGKIDQLFQSFSQIDSSTTREHGGTGLGLAISRRLAELMHGRMWAESEGIPGNGSTFRFTIQAEEAELAFAARRRGGALPELRGKRLLIVDDNATNRRILELQARTWGMQPVLASSAGEALKRICTEEPLDLAILDMHMPTPADADEPADGMALARAICEWWGARRLPLVMLTSMGSPTELEIEALHCFEAWLTKPVKPSQLYDVLVGALAPDAATSAAAPVADIAPSAAPLSDRLPLRILLAEDVALNQKFALLALEQMGYRADVAANGVEALEALDRQPYDVVFMDVQMPELDGLEATRRIRARGAALSQPYIIAMTANAMQGDREACLQAGMDDYVSKPVYLSELRAALERAALGRSEPQPVRAAAVAELLARVDGCELIDLFGEEAVKYMQQVRQAFDSGDATAMARSAHALKGCSGYVGAERLVGLCRKLEESGRAGTLLDAAVIVSETEREIERVREALAEACPA